MDPAPELKDTPPVNVVGRTLVNLAAFIIVIAGIKAAEPIMVPFLLSLFITVLCAPPLSWLQQRNVPVAWAIVIIMSVVVTVALLLVVIVGASVNSFSEQIPLYQERLQLMTQQFSLWLQGLGVSVPQVVWRDYLDPGIAMAFAGQLLSSFGNVMANGFLILLTVIFILTEMGLFMRKMHAVAENAHLSEANLNRFVRNINHYMAIKGWISLVTAGLITLWLAILGVDYAVLWGVLAFLLNFIPNLGSIIAAVPAVLLALVQIGPGTAALAGAGYLMANIVMGNIIEPRFMGKGLDLSTLVVFLSLVFWGWTLGTVGMLLSIPLTMAVKIALESYEETRWIGVILSSGVPEDTQLLALAPPDDQQQIEAGESGDA